MKVYCIGCKKLLAQSTARRNDWYCTACRKRVGRATLAVNVVIILEQTPELVEDKKRIGGNRTAETKIQGLEHKN